VVRVKNFEGKTKQILGPKNKTGSGKMVDKSGVEYDADKSRMMMIGYL